MENPLEISDGGHLPAIAPKSLSALSTSSLIESMGLAKKDEKSLSLLLRDMHSDVLRALEEVRTITTHDDNLEKQYRETVSENVKLKAALYRARRELTTMKGKLTLLEMTSPEIREERQRRLLQSRNMQKQEIQLAEKAKSRNILMCVDAPSFQERARTVDSHGHYINHDTEKERRIRKRQMTFPPHHTTSLPATSPKADPLPPALVGCSCSVCNSQQSLGAVTIGKKKGFSQSTTKSGQQILQGDRVVIRGDHLGVVKYIGKLAFDPLDRVFIGVGLDAPVGITDGMVKGRRYFHCLPSHGVFILPHDILCVTGRKPRSSGTSIPRVREGPLVAKKQSLPLIHGQQDTRLIMTPLDPLTPTPNSLVQANEILEEEMRQLMIERKSPSTLVNPSVAEMSKKILKLRNQTCPQVHTKGDSIKSDEEAEEVQPFPLPMPEDDRDDDHDEPPLLLHDVIMEELKVKDLGDTGYVTITELSSALRAALNLDDKEVSSLISELGIVQTEGQGIKFEDIVPKIVNVIENNDNK